MIKENSLYINGHRILAVSLLALSLSLGVMGSSFAQRDDVTPLVDLTKLVRTAPDNVSDRPQENNASENSDVTTEESDNLSSAAMGEVQTSSEEITATPVVTSSTSISVSSSLTQKDPSSIRLGSLGLDRDDVDGLGRLMWEGSDARVALDLMLSLDPLQTPHALRPALDHIMAARAVPPEGFIDIAPEIINAKLNWLASSSASDDLASMIRQLPDGSSWDDPKAWLIMHDLMIRNDSDACRTAQKKVLITLEAIWHQVNAFCAVIRGEDMKAAFALDILQDSGVDDPVYFSLMRNLTDGDEIFIDDQMDLSLLNIVLMDSARITIEADALMTLPQSYSGTATSLRYLDPAASRLLGARSFGQNGADVTQSWALLPRDDLSATEALTRLRFGGDDDTLAMARLNAWHSISSEKDEQTAASLAFEALLADYDHSGIESLNLWLPLIEGGINSPEIDEKIGPMMGFADEPLRVLLNDEAMAWNDLLTILSRPVSQDVLTEASAYDAIPLIVAMGRPVDEIEWSLADGTLAGLTSGSSLPYAELKQIELTAAQGHKAELVLRLAKLLQGYQYIDLNREDAARLVEALMQVGMRDTAQNLARDILITWGTDRHITSLSSFSKGS